MRLPTLRGGLRGLAPPGLALLGLLLAPSGPTGAQPGGGGTVVGGGPPPHAFLFGSWTGGVFPPVDTEGPACFAQPSVVFTRDVVMRTPVLDIAYRQRLVETVTPGPDGGVTIRLAPPTASVPAQGGRVPPDAGFGCRGDPNLLRVVRRGPDEIAFPDCAEFPSPLRRCTAAPGAAR